MTKGALNLDQLIAGFPGLSSVISKLDAAAIKYGLYGGAYVSLLTANRAINDLDFLVADEDFAKLKSIFPDAQTKDAGKYGPCSFLIIGGQAELEFVANVHINIDDSRYLLPLSAACWQKTSLIGDEKFRLRLLNPVDTILIKAILQRGSKALKHDLEDIEAILKNEAVDLEYLKIRLREVNPDERLLQVLRRFNLI